MASNSNSGTTLSPEAQKYNAAMSQLAKLNKNYKGVVTAVQGYNSNPNSLASRNALFQAMHSNEATRGGAQSILGNQATGQELLNSALAATGVAGMSDLPGLLSMQEEATNWARSNLRGEGGGIAAMELWGMLPSADTSNNGGTTTTTTTSTGQAVLTPGLLGSTGQGSSGGGTLNTLKRTV